MGESVAETIAVIEQAIVDLSNAAYGLSAVKDETVAVVLMEMAKAEAVLLKLVEVLRARGEAH